MSMTRTEQLRELRGKIRRCPEEAACVCGEVLLLRMEMCCDLLDVIDDLPNGDLSQVRQRIHALGIADLNQLSNPMMKSEYREAILRESDALAEVALDQSLFENFVTEYQKLTAVLASKHPWHYVT